jgi:hypothetical protein
MIEVRNPRHRENGPAYYLADFVLHTPKGDIIQEECDIQLTAGNLLLALLQDHEGKNGASDDALLVGECSEAACCGKDFSVHTESDIVRLSWVDPQEFYNVQTREMRAHPDVRIYPNDLKMEKIVAEVPRNDYVEAVLRFAAAYLKAIGVRGEKDEETQKIFEKCRVRYPVIFSNVRSKVERSDIIEFDEVGC